MAILNPIVSKFTIAQNTTQEVYICPSPKTNAVVDITFYKEDITQDAVIAVALSSDPNPANLTSADFFIDNIRLVGAANSAEINKLVIGQGERLYIKVVSGPNITVRVSGVEDTNPKVLKAGRLAALSVAGTTQTQIYANSILNVSYISLSITIFNTSATDANVEIWISTSITPSISDKVFKLTIPALDTTVLEKIFILPNENIFVRSSQPNTEYFINGMCIGV